MLTGSTTTAGDHIIEGMSHADNLSFWCNAGRSFVLLLGYTLLVLDDPKTLPHLASKDNGALQMLVGSEEQFLFVTPPPPVPPTTPPVVAQKR